MVTAPGSLGAGRSAGIAAVAVACLLWGTTGTAATIAPGVGPLAIGAAALGIGGLLQAVIGARPLRRELPLLRTRRPLVLLGAVGVAIYPLAFYSSMQLAGVAIGSVVSLGSAPIFTGLLERIVDGARLGSRWLLAATLGIAGSVLLCTAGFDASGVGGSVVWGVLLGLIAGLAYAGYSWVAHTLMAAGVSRAASMGAVFGGGGLMLMPVLIVTGAPIITSPGGLPVAIYMALVPMFGGYLLFGFALTRIPASTATTLTLAEPAVAAILAVIVVGERLTATGWLGMALIACVLPLQAMSGSAADRSPEAERMTPEAVPVESVP
ncbi:MAG: EamA family transporter [Gordonia sp. (in: high G+C Gram-positive bacteria)]|uniref:DMT family transporter n=1 Tax=Gordonia sp. (in: high G+C Gram-positive bacteria) TaxID=84139 RepID=UPI003C713F25